MPKELGTKATLVSIFPLPLNERKPLIPSLYHIAPAKENDFEVLVIGDAKFHVYLDEHRGSMSIPTPAFLVGEAIVRDFLDGQWQITPDSRPGLIVLPGEWDKEELKKDKEIQSKIAALNVSQNNWFKIIIRIADDEWAKFKQHRMITEVQRIAANRLRLVRDWAVEVKPEEIFDCPACGTLVNTKQAVCNQCSCILNPEIYKNLKFAGTSA